MFDYRDAKCVNVEVTWSFVLPNEICSLRFSLNWLWRILRDIWMYSEDGGSKLLGNIDVCIPIYNLNWYLHGHHCKNPKSHEEITAFQDVTPYTEYPISHVPDHRSCCYSYVTYETSIHNKLRAHFSPAVQLALFHRRICEVLTSSFQPGLASSKKNL
jgi:hypothetical protein